jgi:hypothetical protein
MKPNTKFLRGITIVCLAGLPFVFALLHAGHLFDVKEDPQPSAEPSELIIEYDYRENSTVFPYRAYVQLRRDGTIIHEGRGATLQEVMAELLSKLDKDLERTKKHGQIRAKLPPLSPLDY